MVDLVNELEGKVAIVTGSARNIGRVTAEELARAWAAVVINALSRKSLCEEVAEGICAAGGRAIPVMADCRDEDSIDAMVTAAIKEFGGSQRSGTAQYSF
jgi:NAD(P)-dependent dehydrogenase (short-subunit alcohol dehydrogenase family)